MSASPDTVTAVVSGTPITGVPTGERPTPGSLGLESSDGRYVTLAELGRGGMGRVVRAYDPKLQREVALKEVRRDLLGPELCQRLVVEARAMARLNHPNVVSIYDIHEAEDGRLLLVMEYVAGQTLSDWIEAGSGSWGPIVRHFIAAGYGLAAAHEAGLLHRDFKPANVLVAESDAAHPIVKVTDFGLAKVADADDVPVILGTTDPGNTTETAAGLVMGTPRYMAPEQLSDAELTPAADQYAFCVALWEALAGDPPFSGEDLQAQKFRGPGPWSGPSIPSALIEALRRGLDPKPQERWPGMESLLEALDPDARARRRRWFFGGGGATLVMGGLAFAATGSAPCEGAGDRVGEVWNEASRQGVRAAITDTGASYADRAWSQAESALDDYAAQWIDMHQDACEATAVRGEQSSEVLDLRMTCLQHSMLDLSAAIEELERVDLSTLPRAHALLSELPPLSRCADVEVLLADVAPPTPEDAASVEAARTLLASASAARRAGRYDSAAEHLRAARERATGVGYEPLLGELEREHGKILDQQGELEDAEDALRESLRIATRNHRRAEMGKVLTDLLHVVGHRSRNPERAMQYREMAEELSADDPREAARCKAIVASVLRAWGKLDESEAEQRAALAMREELFGPEDNEVADSRNNLANVLRLQGRYEEAEAEHRRAIAIREKAVGPKHPSTATSYNNLANVLRAHARYDEAEEAHRHALKLRIDALGPEHHDVATSRNNLANVLMSRGDLAEAEVEHRKVLELRRRVLAPTHPDIGMSLNNLGAVISRQGRYADAVGLFEEALQLREAALGPDHPDVATAIANLGTTMFQAGDYEGAHREQSRALEIRKRVLEPNHPELVASLMVLAGVEYELGNKREALAQFMDARDRIVEAYGAEDPKTAAIRCNLATIALDVGDEELAEKEYRFVLEAVTAELPRDHRDVALAQVGLAQLLLRQKRYDEALPFAEAAWKTYGSDDTPPETRAQSAWMLSRSLRHAGRSRARALELATRAAEDYGRAGTHKDAAREEVLAWVRAQD